MGTNGFKEYDADQIAVLLGVVPLASLGGLADGSFLTLKRVTAMFTDKVGTDGEVTRSKTNDRRVEVRFKVMQSSDANAILSAMAIADENASNGAGVTTLGIKDLAGSTVFFAQHCWISEMPESDYDRAAGTREWVFRCASATPWVVGGN